MKKTALFHFAIAFSFAASAGICDVQLKGPLGVRLDKMISNHVAGTDVDQRPSNRDVGMPTYRFAGF